MKNIAIYARWQAIPDVVGRADYVSNPDRQECLLAVAGEQNKEFWAQLAADSQQAWRESGGSKKAVRRGKGGAKSKAVVEKKACEAREIQLMLPAKVLEMSREEQHKLMEELADVLAQKYGLTSLLGLHLSKTDGNVHVHILFPERLRLVEPEVRFASRNVFLDEAGIRCRTKKEILDKQGNLRKGCRIVAKGDIISTRYFGEKEPLFSDPDWCRTCKEDLADWINRRLDPDKRRIVFDADGPYLAQVHIGKGRPDKQAEKIREYNRCVRAFNRLAEEEIISADEAKRIKSFVMLSPDQESALGGALASLALEHPEIQPYLKETLLGNASAADLEMICKVATGGKRTNMDVSQKERKEELRALYRRAEQLRQAARQAPTDFERRILKTEARQCSAQIDRLRRELGLFHDDEYVRKLKAIDEEIKRRHRVVTACRAKVAYVQNRIEWLKKQNREMKAELDQLPVVFRSKETQSKADRLRQLIKNNEAEIEERKEEEKMLELQYIIARVEAKRELRLLKEQRRQLRAERRELRKSSRREKGRR